MSWPLVAIKDVAKVITGKTPSKKSPEFFGGDIPFVTPGDLGISKFVEITPQTLSCEGANQVKVVPKGAVLVSCIGSLGKTSIAGRDLTTNQQINAVVFDESKVDSNFGYYACMRLKPMLEHMAPSTTVAIVNKSNFEALEIPLPPLAEQKRIAAILDKADALRRKRQQAIELADQFLRSVFLDMFGDPVTNPKGWEDLSLGELIAAPLQNGAYYPKEHYVDSGVEMVHMSDAFYDVVQRGSLKRVAAPNKDVEKYALTEDDILISRRSLNLEGAAKPSLIPISDEPLIFESSMIRVTTDQSRLLPKYLFAFLSHPLVKTSRVFQYVTGATIKGISQSNLAKVQVLVPAIEFQREFVGVMNCIDELKLKSLKSGLEIEQAFSSLSQQAFNGKL